MESKYLVVKTIKAPKVIKEKHGKVVLNTFLIASQFLERKKIEFLERTALDY